MQPRGLLLSLLALAACTSSPAPTGSEPPSAPTAPVSGDAANGRSRYAALCAGCHGPTGRGSLAKALVPWTQGFGLLASRIETTMPPDDPTACDATCGADIAAWLLSLPPEEAPVVCDALVPAPRQLRLLTRREYANSLADLLSATPAKACQRDEDCALASESCVAQRCAQDACGTVTFLWRAGGRRPASVHVAGSFNGWAATVAAGGWAMRRGASDVFVLKRAVPPGLHAYKFVVDGQWQTDEANPNRAPDGYGGQNSVLTVQCGAGGSAGGAQDFTRGLPLESRPAGYAFDNGAEAGLATSAHVEAWLAHGATLAAKVQPPCRPTGPDRRPCAAQFVRQFGRRAYRRPLDEAEVARFVGLVASADDFDAGVRAVVTSMLASPHFLYRFELGTAQPDGTFRLGPFEVASALSYALWRSMPDDALLDAAEAGRLATPDDVAREARRLLAHPRARETVRAFSSQWLGLERLATLEKSQVSFPAFTLALREAMQRETPAFVEHVVFDGTGRFDELLTARTSFVEGPLASLYGLSAAPAGVRDLGEARAAGLLSHAGLLAAYAHSDQTSPVKRGVFVREQLLCQHFPPPPANAGGVPRVDAAATTRERFRQHAADPSCRGCHQYIDEVGFGFEGFDALGAARAVEAGRPIDTSGELRDVERFGAGTSLRFTTLPELASALASSRRAKACFAATVFRYTRGRVEAEAERCTVEALADRFVASGGDVKEAFVQALTDERFLSRSAEVMR
ncbi:MAG: DUF1592 domain-containing protein [Myxococcaceae bacterium]|nr:DUF1592 domain-containing protein [Myxococcaceae bacterium]